MNHKNPKAINFQESLDNNDIKDRSKKLESKHEKIINLDFYKSEQISGISGKT